VINAPRTGEIPTTNTIHGHRSGESVGRIERIRMKASNARSFAHVGNYGGKQVGNWAVGNHPQSVRRQMAEQFLAIPFVSMWYRWLRTQSLTARQSDTPGIQIQHAVDNF
jgi:hypothetical protein